jgi:juvenile hormone epoxide hydrolase
VEFQKIIPLLTDPKDSDVNFELVIPSLPGYGFSDGAVRPGLGLVETAQIFVELMDRLGHKKFYIQGGDWGAAIGSTISKVYPEKVAAFHSNFCISQHVRSYLKTFIGSFLPSLYYSAEEAERFLPQSKNFAWLLRETGYLHIQATKPDTVGVGLSHSPSGLAAYILEKFSGWTNPSFMEKQDGGLTVKFSLDEMLDDVMVYWVTKSITTSVRFYAENMSNRQRSYGLDKVPVKIPTGCLVPRWEQYISQPKSIVQDGLTDLISYTYAEDGGHFFALEHPDVLAADFLNFAKLAESTRNLFQ